MGVEDGQRCDPTNSERRTAIEPGPTQPQEPRTSQHVYYIVRWEVLPVV